jgi:cytoskeletal protein CcmA (bactofilin family)
MIRMGRNSRTEPSNDSTGYQEGSFDPAPGNLYSTENSLSSKVSTDSESMARDIKEGRLSGFVGHGTVLTGETIFQAMLRVDGHLVGTVSSEAGTMIVGTEGQVDANVSVASAMVNGAVNGDIIATEKLHLGRTARVIGNVMTPRIVIEEGAVLEGGCTMLKAREDVQKREAAQSRYQDEQRYETAYSSVSEDHGYAAEAPADDEDNEDEAEKAEAAIS